jgi:hypothetical protein
MFKILNCFLVFTFICNSAIAQEIVQVIPQTYSEKFSATENPEQEEDEPQPVRTFRSSRLINVQTTEPISRRGLEFNIMHRFGVVRPDESLLREFLGLDLPSNIRLGFAIPIGERFHVGIGRTKFNKTYDLEGKYTIFRQMDDNSMPVSVAAYFNTAIMTTRFPIVPDGATFAGSGIPFEYRFSHRLLYNTQIIVSRQFTNWLALQTGAAFIFRNLAPQGRNNLVIGVPISGAIRTGLTSSVIFEYNLVVNETSINNLNPFSLGYEVGTVGHKFQIFLSTTQQLLEQFIYTAPPVNYLEGNFLLGFNIKRTF